MSTEPPSAFTIPVYWGKALAVIGHLTVDEWIYPAIQHLKWFAVTNEGPVRTRLSWVETAHEDGSTLYELPRYLDHRTVTWNWYQLHRLLVMFVTDEETKQPLPQETIIEAFRHPWFIHERYCTLPNVLFLDNNPWNIRISNLTWMRGRSRRPSKVKVNRMVTRTGTAQTTYQPKHLKDWVGDKVRQDAMEAMEAYERKQALERNEALIKQGLKPDLPELESDVLPVSVRFSSLIGSEEDQKTENWIMNTGWNDQFVGETFSQRRDRLNQPLADRKAQAELWYAQRQLPQPEPAQSGKSHSEEAQSSKEQS